MTDAILDSLIEKMRCSKFKKTMYKKCRMKLSDLLKKIKKIVQYDQRLPK